MSHALMEDEVYFLGLYILKYCPAIWIWLKVGSFDWSLLKRERRGGFKKYPPIPHPVGAL
jgi:hypothetical protein